MRRKIVQIVFPVLALLLFLRSVSGASFDESWSRGQDSLMRIGLYYGASAQNALTLSHYRGRAYQIGYYNADNQFTELATTEAPSISVTKTWNMHYGTVDRYPSYYTSDILTGQLVIGCYHIQSPERYSDYAAAAEAALRYEDGFVAYINEAYRVRFGSYLSRAEAKEAVAGLGDGYEVGDTSSFGINVVETGTDRILFQYDDGGNGLGLGIIPGYDVDGEAPVTWLQSGASRNVYYGGFRFERVGGQNLVAVNLIQIDDYVKGVIYREMSAAWELEALKAQAVCARTYGLYHASRQKHSDYHFDLCTTTDCQVYDGVYISGTEEKIQRVNRAVDETAGQIMTVGGEPIEALYYSSNGGASEDSGNVWGATLYLVGKRDPYEQTIEIPNYHWTASYTGKELQQKLIDSGYTGCDVIERVQVMLTDNGNAYSLVFTDRAGKSYTRYKNSCRTFLRLRSLRYTVSGDEGTEVLGGDLFSVNEGQTVNLSEGLSVISGDGRVSSLNQGYMITSNGLEEIGQHAQLSGSTASGQVFTFSGSGYGHNVGMSQYGAYAMALSGHSYLDILQFYYTGVTIESC